MRRVLLLSHTYVHPAHRGKLRALAARSGGGGDLEVTVAIPQRWREPWFGRPYDATWERQGGLEIFPLPAKGMGSRGELDRAVYGRRALRAMLRDRRPDLVQIEEEPDTPAARQVFAAARRLAIPVVLFTRATVPRSFSLFARWKQRRLLRRLLGAVAGSSAAAELVRSHAPALPVAVIPQLGVEPPHEPVHTPHEGLHIAFVGRLVHHKGLDTLLQALALHRGAKWYLTVIGEGPGRETLEEMVTDLRLAARVRWAGGLPAEQVAPLWPELDVLVQPSRVLPGWREPNGHPLAEAMAHEVAVVGTDGGVIPEIIGDAGLVVPAADVPALAGALDALNDPVNRRRLAEAARARALRLYSDDAIAERTLLFWQGILK
ncbi:MAG: glycosyltransferase family 4 protein [Gemmatimonadales bacterium]